MRKHKVNKCDQCETNIYSRYSVRAACMHIYVIYAVLLCCCFASAAVVFNFLRRNFGKASFYALREFRKQLQPRTKTTICILYKKVYVHVRIYLF